MNVTRAGTRRPVASRASGKAVESAFRAQGAHAPYTTKGGEKIRERWLRLNRANDAERHETKLDIKVKESNGGKRNAKPLVTC
jgi:hypothetical protein